MQGSHLTSSHKLTEIFSLNHSTLLLFPLEISTNFKLLAKRWSTLKSMASNAVLYLLICKFLDLTKKNFIHKLFLSNFQRMVNLEMRNCMKFLRSTEKSRVWKHQLMKITPQEDTDLFVTITLNQQEMHFKTSQRDLMCVNSNHKMWKKPRESLSTTFTWKTFLLKWVILKSRKCSSLLETLTP